MNSLCSRASRLTAAVATAIAASANADVIVSNLAEPLRATTDIGNNPNPVPPPSMALEWSWAAQSFSTDNMAYSLTRIDLIAGQAAADPVVVAELRENDGGAIGALITTLSVPDLTGAPSPRTFVPDAPVTLAPSTTYWVVLGSAAPGDGTFGLSYANSNASVGVGSIGSYADSQDSGTNWNYGTKFPYFIQAVGEKSMPCSGCPGDANGDGMTNFADITAVLENWNTSCR